MSIEENKAIDRRFTEELFNKGNLAIVDELVATADHGSVVQGNLSKQLATRSPAVARVAAWIAAHREALRGIPRRYVVIATKCFFPISEYANDRRVAHEAMLIWYLDLDAE